MLGKSKRAHVGLFEQLTCLMVSTVGLESTEEEVSSSLCQVLISITTVITFQLVLVVYSKSWVAFEKTTCLSYYQGQNSLLLLTPTTEVDFFGFS